MQEKERKKLMRKEEKIKIEIKIKIS